MNSLSCIREKYRQKGTSPQITEVIMQSWKSGTGNKYSTYQKQWIQFSSERNQDPLHPQSNNILNFLHSYQIRNVGYGVLNTIHSMLSFFVEIDDIEVGKHPVICRYVKGAYNMNPSLPKHNFTWDVGTVGKYLRNASSEKLYDLSKKLATLTVILSGQRPKEILGVIDIRNLSFEENFLVIRVGDIMKTSNKKYHIGEIKSPRYRENDKICVFACMKEYLQLTANLRGNITHLYHNIITTAKPYKSASQDTLARCIKTTLQSAGIDMSTFAPHSTRSASTSRVVTRIPIDTVLKTWWWRSMRTFAKHYNKDIIFEENFANSILN